MMARNKRKSKLETAVMKSKPLKDEKGRYLPYCDFGYHQGITRTPKICEERECQYYIKLYILKQ